MAQAMWINGETVTGSSDESIEVLNPYTEANLDTVPAGTAEDVERAVEAAHAAFGEWRRVPAVERADYLHEVARRLRESEQSLARQLACFVNHPDLGGAQEASLRCVEGDRKKSFFSECFLDQIQELLPRSVFLVLHRRAFHKLHDEEFGFPIPLQDPIEPD